MLINATQEEELRIALVVENILYDLDVERSGYNKKKANIYEAIVTSVEPSLNAAFVNYGSERHGFLPFKEVAREFYINQSSDLNERPNIKDVLKEGQEIMVQVEKEERGNKGAALTTFISLAGSYLVLMPTNPRAGGISRQIEGEERDELRTILSQLTIPENMGVIVRTAGVGKSLEELQWDLNVQLKHWDAIKQAAKERQAPFLIHQERDMVIRAIRDYLRQDIAEIIIDDPAVFEKAKQYVGHIRPDFLERLKLYQSHGHAPLFSFYKIEEQIESAFQREVRLPSGGSIVIDHTEALVTVDINSARSTKGSDIEETAFNTNLEAADEIARQLRLRDIGGLVVIDFIDMTPVRHQREVENRLRNALKLDRARIQIGRISRFGLLEMSRQRLRPSLREAMQIVCPSCNGQGTVRGVESLAISIIRVVEEAAILEGTAQIQVQLPLDVATFLLNEKRETIAHIEESHKLTILIIPNPHLQSPQYRIKRLKEEEAGSASGRKAKSSYKLVETPDLDMPQKTSTETVEEKPAVKAVYSEPSPMPRRTASNAPSLIKRLWTSMFGSPETETATKPSQVKEDRRGRSDDRSRSDDRNRSPRSTREDRREDGNRREAGPRKTAGSGSASSQHNNRTRRGTRGGRRRGSTGGRSYQKSSENLSEPSNIEQVTPPIAAKPQEFPRTEPKVETAKPETVIEKTPHQEVKTHFSDEAKNQTNYSPKREEEKIAQALKASNLIQVETKHPPEEKKSDKPREKVETESRDAD
jgi:ribonuclease E